jgi:hypothetical protein
MVLYFHLKGMLARTVHANLLVTLAIEILPRATYLPSSTVSKRLTNSLAFLVRHLRWVPHLLSKAQRPHGARLSSPLPWVPQVQQQKAWHDVVAFDECWFYSSINDKSVRPRSSQNIAERVPTTVQCTRLMITMV